MSDEKFIIEKRGLYYRPNARGYTGLKSEAGRYSFEEAVLRVGPNGPEGPQDGLGMWRESEAPDCSSNCPWDLKLIDEAERKAYRDGFSAGVRNADEEAALKALADMGQEWDADTAAAQVAAAYERAADLCVDQFQAHLDLVITGNPDNARNRESAANMAEKLSHEIRALATDTQTDALELVRRDAERAGYEWGVREALDIIGIYDESSDCPYCCDVAAINEKVTALLDKPTPDPDEQTEAAQDLAFRKAVSS